MVLSNAWPATTVQLDTKPFHTPCLYPTYTPGPCLLGPAPHASAQANFLHQQPYCPTDINQELSALTLGQSNNQWYMDSGASTHVSNNAGNIQTFYPYDFQKHLFVGNGTSIPIHAYGSSTSGTASFPYVLNHILYSPHIVKKFTFR